MQISCRWNCSAILLRYLDTQLLDQISTVYLVLLHTTELCFLILPLLTASGNGSSHCCILDQYVILPILSYVNYFRICMHDIHYFKSCKCSQVIMGRLSVLSKTAFWKMHYYSLWTRVKRWLIGWCLERIGYFFHSHWHEQLHRFRWHICHMVKLWSHLSNTATTDFFMILCQPISWIPPLNESLLLNYLSNLLHMLKSTANYIWSITW